MEECPLEMKQLFFNNLQLLGFDVADMEATNHIPFNKNMFDLPNKRGAEIVLHFLFEKLNPTMCREAFRDVWPILEKKREAAFRKTCANWLSNISQEDPDSHLPRINASLFMSPGGDKFYQLLLYFSGYVLQKILDNELGSKSSDKLKYPSVSSQNIQHAEVMMKAFSCSTVRHRKNYFDVAQLTTKAGKAWKEAADDYVKDHRKLSKEIRELDYEIREEDQRALENSLTRGSPTKKQGRLDNLDPNFDPRTIKRAQRVQYVRDMWKQLDDFERTEAAEREIIESIVERTINKYKIDATEIHVKVPDMLLRECGEEIRRRNVSNTYQGGRLNLESVLQLWNLCLNLYLEKLKEVGMPKFDEDVKKLTSQVHVQHNYLQNAKTLRNQMSERVPVLKESIENLRERLDTVMFKDESPSSIRTTVSDQNRPDSIIACQNSGFSSTGVKLDCRKFIVQPSNVKGTKDSKTRTRPTISNSVHKSSLDKARHTDLNLSTARVITATSSDATAKSKVNFSHISKTNNFSNKTDNKVYRTSVGFERQHSHKTVKSSVSNSIEIENDIKPNNGISSNYISQNSKNAYNTSSMSHRPVENFMDETPVSNQNVELDKQILDQGHEKYQLEAVQIESDTNCYECGPVCMCGKTCIGMRSCTAGELSVNNDEKSSEYNTVLEESVRNLDDFESELRAVNLHPDDTMKVDPLMDHEFIRINDTSNNDHTLQELDTSSGFTVKQAADDVVGQELDDCKGFDNSILSTSSGYQSKQSNTPQSVATMPMFSQVNREEEDSLIFITSPIHSHISNKRVLEQSDKDSNTQNEYKVIEKCKKNQSDLLKTRGHNIKDMFCSENTTSSLVPSDQSAEIWSKFSPLKDMSMTEDNEHDVDLDITASSLHEVSVTNKAITPRKGASPKTFLLIKDMLAEDINLDDVELADDQENEIQHFNDVYTELRGFDHDDGIITIGCFSNTNFSLVEDRPLKETFFDSNKNTKHDSKERSKKQILNESEEILNKPINHMSTINEDPNLSSSSRGLCHFEATKGKKESSSYFSDSISQFVNMNTHKTKRLAMGHLTESSHCRNDYNIWERLRQRDEKKKSRSKVGSNSRAYFAHNETDDKQYPENYQPAKQSVFGPKGIKKGRPEESPRLTKKSLGVGLVEPSPEPNFSPGAAVTPAQPLEVPRNNFFLDTPTATDQLMEEMKASIIAKQLFTVDVDLLADQGKKDSAIPRPGSSKGQSQTNSRQSSRPTSARSTASSKGSRRVNMSTEKSGKPSTPKDRDIVFPKVSSPKTMVERVSQMNGEKLDISLESIPHSARSNDSSHRTLSARSDKSNSSSSTAKASQSSRSIKSHSSGRLSARSHDSELAVPPHHQGRKSPVDLLVDEIMGKGQITSPLTSGLEAFESRNLIRRTPDLEEEENKENIEPDEAMIQQLNANCNNANNIIDDTKDEDTEDIVDNEKLEGDIEWIVPADNNLDSGIIKQMHNNQTEGDEDIDLDKIEFEEIMGPELEDEYNIDVLSEGSHRSEEQVIVIDRSQHLSPRQTQKENIHNLDNERFPSTETSPRELIVIDHSFQRSPGSKGQENYNFSNNSPESLSRSLQARTVDRDQVKKDVLSKSLILERSPLSEEIRQMFQKAAAETPPRPQSSSVIFGNHDRILMSAPDYDGSAGSPDELDLPNMDINSRQKYPPVIKTADISWEGVENIDDIEMPNFDDADECLKDDNDIAEGGSYPDTKDFDQDASKEKNSDFTIPGVCEIDDIDEFFKSKTPELVSRSQRKFNQSINEEDQSSLVNMERSSFEIPKFPEKSLEEDCDQLISFTP